MKDYSKIDMRDALFDEIYEIAKNDKNVVVIVADTDAFSLHRFKEDFPDQYINVGVAEQNMILVAAGLAMCGKKVFLYSLIPFIALRCFEQIKVNICSMNLPVTIIGGGAGFSFGYDGPTHHAVCDIAIMRTLPEIKIYNISDSFMAKECAHIAHTTKSPLYIRLDKGKVNKLYDDVNFTAGASIVRKGSGSDLCIFSTGTMTHTAIAVANELLQYGIDAFVIDVHRLKDINKFYINNVLDRFSKIVTIEENSIVGGLGSILAEIICDEKHLTKISLLQRIALPDEQAFIYGNRDFLHKYYGLDKDSIVETITEWIATNEKKTIKK